MNSKFEEILNLANSLSFTSFPIADDVLNLQDSLKYQTTSLTEFNDSFNTYCNGVRDMEENICSVFSKISGITVGISEFRGVSAISENGQVDKNKVIQLMLKNPNDLTNGEKEILSYVEKVLGKDEYAELKEQAIKEDNGQGIADNLKLKFGDTSIYGPFLELANNDGFLKSIKKAGEDFIIGAGNSLDKNIFLGTVFTVGGINQSSMPKSIPYKIGELAGDIGSFAFGAAEAGTGAGGELLGFTADATGVLAPAGVALNVASLGLVTHGGAATIKSAHNFSEDLFSLIKGEGNQGVSKADILQQNRVNGRKFETEALEKMQESADDVVEQITIKSKSGTRTRLDAIGIDKDTGEILIEEYKASSTAPLTKNQKIAHPEIETDGGVVVGKGKPPFIGGTEIPPTKIKIIRK
ncbi:hypothetical protein [Clostridium kluyveri]|uniref:LXG domain-containing protein n=1 Tax=Clostridium kluyveri TaxID=1534 RepID=A0A1L5FBJ9_CLOKL|nr:hypothetical protein [Clostridium kluyveri]APM40388.1 hypothetical protein BS101_17430 [Clostridium kluyveri]